MLHPKVIYGGKNQPLINVVGAVATRGDVMPQITLAVPLYLLFELGILLSYFASRRKRLQSGRW